MHPNETLKALFREYWNRENVTRTEVGTMVGLTRGQMAQKCRVMGLKNWTVVRPKDKQNRTICQFPMGVPGTKTFHVCGKPLAEGNPLVCEEHIEKIWPLE